MSSATVERDSMSQKPIDTWKISAKSHSDAVPPSRAASNCGSASEFDLVVSRLFAGRQFDGLHTRERLQHLLGGGDGPWAGNRGRFCDWQQGPTLAHHDPPYDDKVRTLLVVSLGPEPRAQLD